MSDCVACQFLITPRWGSHRCKILTDPETMRNRDVACSGLPGLCPCPALREREIARVLFAQRALDDEAVASAQRVREWARQGLERLVGRLTARRAA